MNSGWASGDAPEWGLELRDAVAGMEMRSLPRGCYAIEGVKLGENHRPLKWIIPANFPTMPIVPANRAIFLPSILLLYPTHFAGKGRDGKGC